MESIPFSEISTITILVGPDQKSFLIHEAHLTSASPYFKAALEPDKFKEGQERLIRLPEVDLTVFELFVKWLYAQRVDLLFDKRLFGSQQEEQIKRAIDLFIFANGVLASALKQAIYDLLVKFARNEYLTPSMNEITRVYEHTIPNAPLRRLMIDWYAYAEKENRWDPESEKVWLARVPEFAADLVVTLKDMAEKMARSTSTENPLYAKPHQYREAA